MTKFKVGDKVRKKGPPDLGITEGKVYEVVEYERFLNGRRQLGIFDDDDDFISVYSKPFEKVGEEMNYEVGKPYLWFGGECPLPEGTIVKVRFGDRDFYQITSFWSSINKAGRFHWGHEFRDNNILMFKVMEYPKETHKIELELTEEEMTTIKEVLGKVNL